MRAHTLILVLVSGCSTAGYLGPVSDHFDGKAFRNLAPFEERGFLDVLAWKQHDTAAEWPDNVDVATATPPAYVEGDTVRVTMVNHATVLLQTAAVNILTDPVWSDRVSPLSWAGPSRHRVPGIAFDALPPIHVVLFSHDHYDHCDLETLHRLVERDHPVIIAGLGMDRFLSDEGIGPVVALDWWEDVAIRHVRFAFTPAQHGSTRTAGARNHRLWGSFIINTGTRAVYFAGDTGGGPHFAAIADRYGEPDIALLPIGAYEPRWFMTSQHMNPADAVDAALALGARKAIGIHWGTFQLTDEPIDQPLIDLELAKRSHGMPADGFITLDNGGVFASTR